MPIAYNRATGEALRLDQAGAWVPTKVAVNPQTGENLALDGGQWVKFDKPVSLANEVASVGAGANKGIAGGLGSVVDLATGVINYPIREAYGTAAMLGSLFRGDLSGAPAAAEAAKASAPQITTPIGGSESIKAGLNAAGFSTTPTAETIPGRIASRVAQEVGGVAAMAAGPVALAGKAYEPVSQGGQAILRALTPKTVGEAAQAGYVAAGAGTGAGIANEVAPGSQVADTVGAILGALSAGGLQAAFNYATGGVKAVAAPFTESGRRAIAGNAIKRTATNPENVVSAIDNAEPGIAGVQQTTAAVTRDPGLATVERGLRSADPSQGGQFAVRDAQNNAARRTALENIQPGAEGPQMVRDFFQRQLASVRDVGQDTVNAATARVSAAIERLGPGATPEAAGRIIRAELQAVRDSAVEARTAETAPLYEAARNSDAAVNTDPVLAHINERLAVTKGDIRSAVETARKNLFVGQAPDTSVAGLMESRKAINSQISAAQRAGQNDVARELLGIRNQLDDALDAVPQVGEANARFRELSAPVNALEAPQAPAIGKALERDQFGNTPTTPDAAVPALFFRPGQKSQADVASFIQQAGGRPQAMQALRDYAIGDIRASGALNPDGTVNPQRWTSWMRRHGDALRAFPELMRDLRSVDAAQRTLDGAGAAAAQSVESVERSAARFFLDSDPDKAIAAALSGSRPQQNMVDLVRLARADQSGAALRGLQRGIIATAEAAGTTTATDVVGNPQLAAAPFVRWWTKNRQAISPAFSGDQIKLFDAISNDLQRRAAVDNAGRAAGSNTVQNLATGNVLQALIGRLVPDRFAVADMSVVRSIARPLGFIYKEPEQRIQQLLYSAMLDPQLARDLVSRVTPQNAPIISEHLRNALSRIPLVAGAPGDRTQGPQAAPRPALAAP